MVIAKDDFGSGFFSKHQRRLSCTLKCAAGDLLVSIKTSPSNSSVCGVNQSMLSDDRYHCDHCSGPSRAIKQRIACLLVSHYFPYLCHDMYKLYSYHDSLLI